MRAFLLFIVCATLLTAQAIKPVIQKAVPRTVAPKAAIPGAAATNKPFAIQPGPEFPAADLRRWPVLLGRDGGRVLLAWESLNPADRIQGEAALYDERLSLEAGPVATSNLRADFFGTVHSAATFANGNVLVAYNDRKDHRITLGLFDARLKPLKAPFLLAPYSVGHLVLTRLSGGNTVAAIYFDGQMRMAILDAQGAFALPPKAIVGDIRSDRLDGLAATTLPDGLILVAYAPNFLMTALLDPLGNNVRDPKRLPTNPQATALSVVSIEGDRAAIGYLDRRNDTYRPTLAFVNAGGELDGGFVPLWTEAAEWMKPVRMSDGGILTLIDPAQPDPDRGLLLVKTDARGTMVAGPQVIEEDYTYEVITQDLIALPGNRALAALSGFNGDNPQKRRRNRLITIR